MEIELHACAISKCIYSTLKHVPNIRINKGLILTLCKITLNDGTTNEKYFFDIFLKNWMFY